MQRYVEPDSNVPANISTEWLYSLSRDVWSQWLSPDTHADILRGGFYANRVLDQLWIVAVNNNFCYNYNLYMRRQSNFFTEGLICVDLQLESVRQRGPCRPTQVAGGHFVPNRSPGGESALVGAHSFGQRSLRQFVDERVQ